MNNSSPTVAPVIQSPCVRICKFDQVDGRCLGCSRTPEEIRGWFKLSISEKQAVIDSIPERMRERIARRSTEQQSS